MHRRHLLAAALTTLIPRSLPVSAAAPDETAVSWVFRAFAVPSIAARDELAVLNVKVWEFGSCREAADAFAVAVTHLEAPVPSANEEVSVVDMPVIAPAPDLKIHTYTTVAGAAAVATSYGVAVMRRADFLWVIRASTGQGSEFFGGLAGIMSDLASRLADRRIQVWEVTMDDDGLFRGGLWDLLPDLEDVPGRMILSEQRSGGDVEIPATPVATVA